MLKLRPIIVNKEGMILGGNMRYHALKAMGVKECWVEVAEVLSLEQEKEFIIKDNTNFGEWDFDILANEFTDLPLIDWGLDVGNLEQGNIDDFFERDDNKKEEEKKICPNCGAIL
jgi:ParB-like chromosome segregation protein Spo0J